MLSTRVGWLHVGEYIGWVHLLEAIERPALWREGGGARRCIGTKVGFIVPWHTRCPRSREVVLVWGLGSRGWVEIEEGGLVGVDGREIAASRETIILGLVWFNCTIVGGCLAKGLDGVVVRGDIAGKHVAGGVKVG